MNDNLDEGVHPASLAPEALLRQCQVRRVRRSGPGGQHRNKVETGVVLHHRLTGIQAEANERRSQVENRRVALNRLRLKLALGVRSTADLVSSPSPLWQDRCRNGRIAVSATHTDFPTLLAEALDTIFRSRQDITQAARQLECTSSQLVKLLKVEPVALKHVNSCRCDVGLKRLK